MVRCGRGHHRRVMAIESGLISAMTAVRRRLGAPARDGLGARSGGAFGPADATVDAPRLRLQVWRPVLIVGLLLAAGAAMTGDEDVVRAPLTLLGLATVVLIFIGIHLNRPSRPLAWRLVGLCTLATTVAINLLPRIGLPGLVIEAVLGIGYLSGMVGFVLLVRGRIPGGDRGAFIDAAIIATSIALVILALELAPFLAGASNGSFAAAIFFYVALVASGAVIRMWFLPGAHRPATRLIVLLVLTSNAIFVLNVLRAVTGSEGLIGPFIFAEFASLAIIGAAALHPSMAISPERQPAMSGPISRRRLVLLTLALLVNPLAFAIEFSAGRSIDPIPYLVGGVIIAILVVARLGEVMRQLAESLRERGSLMELLRRQALYDGLTGLANRSLFNEHLSQSFLTRATDGILAVLLIDLDEFKAVNDTYGHDAGDTLLIAVAERIRGCVRQGDTAARLGGDEFVVILRGCTDPAMALGVGERVLTALNEPYILDNQSVRARASVGLAIAGPGELVPEDLTRHADIAMYLAKDRGKGRLEVYLPGMQAAAVTNLQLRSDLEIGISEGDLRLHYQPVVDLRTGQTLGLEALVRWQRGSELVPPLEFIPVAEASGLIEQLTDWVLCEACRTASRWGDGDDRPWVSVNLSPSQLLRANLTERIMAALAATGLPADRLVLEITESSILDIDAAGPAIERLHAIGVRIAIDDFGTGYSALSYLARLPVDFVKIDRSFVAALANAGPEDAIAAAIVDLARRLNLTTIGEGIESSSQLDRLASLGCDLGQGYHIARPSPNLELDSASAGRRSSAVLSSLVARPA